jgi:hypothetical protein
VVGRGERVGSCCCVARAWEAAAWPLWVSPVSYGGAAAARLRDRMFHVKRPETTRVRRCRHHRRFRPGTSNTPPTRVPRETPRDDKRPPLPGFGSSLRRRERSVAGPTDDRPSAWHVHSARSHQVVHYLATRRPNVPRETSPNRGAPAAVRRAAERRDCAPLNAVPGNPTDKRQRSRD